MSRIRDLLEKATALDDLGNYKEDLIAEKDDLEEKNSENETEARTTKIENLENIIDELENFEAAIGQIIDACNTALNE